VSAFIGINVAGAGEGLVLLHVFSEVTDGGTLTPDEIVRTLESTIDGIRQGNLMPDPAAPPWGPRLYGFAQRDQGNDKPSPGRLGT
jgi:hypothetical protein